MKAEKPDESKSSKSLKSPKLSEAQKSQKALGQAKPAIKATSKPSLKSPAQTKTAAEPLAKAVVKVPKPAVVVTSAVQSIAKPGVAQNAKPNVKTGSQQGAVVVKKAGTKVAAGVALDNTAKPLATGKLASKPAERTPSAKPTKQSLVLAAVKAARAPTQVKAAPASDRDASHTTAPAPQAAPHITERSQPMTSPPALKPGRRSSARAPSQLPPPAPMVPTHAPDAAKASYAAMTERVMAPPPHVAAKKDPKLVNNWKSKPANELTDDEVKAMPDLEYMNDKQLAFFRHRLSVLKQEIHNSAGETTEHLREETVVVPDPADRATIEEEHALELRTRDRERKLLKKIEQSIGRIDSGDYGYCDETGEPIGVGRLIARPTANLSLEAQQRRELKQKMFGD